MAIASESVRTIVVVLAIALNVCGWFWLADRLDRLTNRSQAPRPPFMPMPMLGQMSSPPWYYGMIGDDVSIPPVENPALRSAHEVELDDDAAVIGVEIDGESRAYVVDAFALRGARSVSDITVHAVQDVIGDRAICVTHCDLTHSTRVFTRDAADADVSAPPDVRLGGFRQGLLLVVDGTRFPHHSPDIPLRNVAFVTTTWAAWRAEHPETLVYARG